MKSEKNKLCQNIYVDETMRVYDGYKNKKYFIFQFYLHTEIKIELYEIYNYYCIHYLSSNKMQNIFVIFFS